MALFYTVLPKFNRILYAKNLQFLSTLKLLGANDGKRNKLERMC